VLLLAIYQYRNIAVWSTLTHESPDGIWHLNCADEQPFSGKLVCAGYRSAFLVILVLQHEDTRYQYCLVWQDQISNIDFSYLHHQMLFNTSPPQHQSLKFKLLGVKIF